MQFNVNLLCPYEYTWMDIQIHVYGLQLNNLETFII